MSAIGAGAILLGAFLAAQAAGARLSGRARVVPLALLASAVLFAGFELARYDLGRPDLLFGIAFVGAPVVLIFGAAAAGVRRWYGWPDLGPVPGRLAAVACALLLGVLAGTRVKDADVAASADRGTELAAAIRGWRDAHGGAWPPRLEDASPAVPPTRMGMLAPPAFRWDPATHRLSFPLGGERTAVLDVADDPARATWSLAR